MAAYPDLPLSRESSRSVINGTVIDMADDGTVWLRNYHTELVYEFSLVHSLITEAQKNTLESFYATNKGLQVTLVYKKDSVSYNCYFIGPPETDKFRGTKWNARSSLRGTKV